MPLARVMMMEPYDVKPAPAAFMFSIWWSSLPAKAGRDGKRWIRD